MVTDAQAALRFLEGRPPDLGEVREALASIVKGGFRTGDVIDRIRALVRKAPPRTERVDMNEAIREVIAVTRGEAARNGISVEAQLADGLPLIQGDLVQLQQVVLNLVLNAIEAMAGDDKGPRELLIKTVSPGSDSVIVAVQDSGPGLDAASPSTIFEPFHTTKPDGLGIGLSISRSIVEAHGGKLVVTANVPRGAIFQFTLPARGYGS
jgi:C4-dicarboxylate-specific signal transduction histidine kinase